MTTWINHWRGPTVPIGHVYRAEVTLRNGRRLRKKLFVVLGTGVICALPGDRPNTGRAGSLKR